MLKNLLSYNIIQNSSDDAENRCQKGKSYARSDDNMMIRTQPAKT